MTYPHLYIEAESSSYSSTSSIALVALTLAGGGSGSGPSISSSYAATASYVTQAISASYTQTASYVVIAQTASYVQNAVSSSYVQTAQTASYVLTSSYARTASFIVQAISASYVQTASYVSSIDKGEVIINFGLIPGTGFASAPISSSIINKNSSIHLYVMSTSSIDHSEADHQILSLYSKVIPNNIVNNTSFDVNIITELRLTGTFLVKYTINNN